MTNQEEIREALAELEHEQWVKWSQSIVEVETLSPDRLARWEKLWIPYANLTEEQKDQDRVWADKSIELLHSQGVVIRIKDFLNSQSPESDFYYHIEPLIIKEDSNGKVKEGDVSSLS